MYERYKNTLSDLTAKSNLRILPNQVPAGAINVSSNDYLGLASDMNLLAEFTAKHQNNPLAMTASSSRLLKGHCSYYKELEDLLAASYQREAALVYNSGYHANIGILPALVGKQDIVLADKLVHASIIDGLRLCVGEVKRYNHCNYEHLERMLKDSVTKYEKIFIVTESVFSMDGDTADLAALVALKDKYGAFLYVDEAHAVGACGERGLGECEVQGLVQQIDFIVGTFGKALASQGAFVIANRVICDYLINTSRSFIFTTALPPAVVAWSLHIYRKQLEANDLRTQLAERGTQLRNILQCTVSNSHIVPFIVGENAQAVALSAYMRENGFHVLPIRHPTVPQGTARLRFSLSSIITKENINDMVALLNKGNSLLF